MQAWSDDGTGLPASLLEALPIATTTSKGIMQVGTGLSVTAGVVSVATGGGMVYPTVGIPLSTGTAWGTSIVNNSANWNTAYSHTLLTTNPHTVTAAQVGLGSVENAAASTLYSVLAHVHTFASLTSKPTTIAGYGITDAQALDGDLTAIAALSGTTGLLKKTAANTWALDTTPYTTNLGTVTSVGMTVPTGLTVTGTPITSSGTLALSLTAGYSIPTTASQTNWNTAYGWGDWETGVTKTYVDALGIDATNLGGIAAANYYHSGNANLSTVNWNAKNLYVNDIIYQSGTSTQLDINPFSNLRIFRETNAADPYFTIFKGDNTTESYFSVRANNGAVTAGSITLTNLTTGYIPYKSATTLVNSPIYTTAAAGNVLIGTTTDITGYKLNVNGNAFVIGNILATGEVTAYSTSDSTLKTNIKQINSATDILKEIPIYTFNWNDNAVRFNSAKDTMSIQYGTIAQLLQKKHPELVHKIYNEEKLGVDYISMIPLLVQAIQEADTRNDKLEKRIVELEKLILK
jgi:hypothetical protein